MPIRPKKEIQKRGAGGNFTEASYRRFMGDSMIRLLDGFEEDGFDTGAFWKNHKAKIMERYLEENRRKGKGWAGYRPDAYWSDLKEPRLHINVKLADNELWDNKKVEPSGREGDYAYLKRLGLLEAWELEAEEKGKK